MLGELRITEVFVSLQGESKTSGLPTVFVRLTGCPLRCGYCDSEYAFHGGVKRTVSSLLAEVVGFECRHVCITGGEPLAQKGVHPFLEALCDRGFNVSIETSGALPVDMVDKRVSIVMDLKTPGSGEVEKNIYANISQLDNKDQIKFVITSREDYQWARFKLDEYHLHEVVGEVLFSTSYDDLEAKDLAEWIVRDRLPVRFQLQLHKILWGDVPGV